MFQFTVACTALLRAQALEIHNDVRRCRYQPARAAVARWALGRSAAAAAQAEAFQGQPLLHWWCILHRGLDASIRLHLHFHWNPFY